MKQEFPIQVTGKAFLLRSDIPPEGRPRPKSADGSDASELTGSILASAQEAGLIKMKRPPFISFTLPSLEATEYAQEQGKFEQFHKACYQAYWEELQDLGKLEVLEGIAKGCGLDWQELEERLKTGYYRKEVLRQYLEGRQLGFQGIPGFTIGYFWFTGAAPYEVFRSAAERSLSPETPGPRLESEG